MEAMGVSLSDIKFKYIGKIQNIDDRIQKYGDFVRDYDEKIKTAKEKEIENISSISNLKSNYEKKIVNMKKVREYYQEFVDTSDYLMQNINSKEMPLLKSKCEQLESENHSLSDKINELEILLDDTKVSLEKYKKSNENNKSKLFNLKNDYNKRMEEIKEYKLRMKAKDEAYSSLRDRKRKEKIKTATKYVEKSANKRIRKLSAENQMLKDTNDFLERKNQELQDYCNDLLNRPMVGGE